MTFTQKTFLGASIRNFNGSVGWGQQASVLQVGLVEDPANGDSFSPDTIGIGGPAYFDYQGWEFGGLIQSYKKNYGSEGNPVYEVQLQDPRELLSGVQLILQNYNGGTYNIPNLYNVYGYLESQYGFGGSLSNDSGIPWYLIQRAFYNLQISSPIRFQGHTYFCDGFYNMPTLLPDYYRIGGDSISALDFIADVASTAGCDFIIKLVYEPSTGRNLIRVKLMYRRLQPELNKIEEYISSKTNISSKDHGYELRNEVCTKFVTGGPVCDMYFQSYQSGDNDTEGESNIVNLGGPLDWTDNTILPYWGKDYWGNLIIGELVDYKTYTHVPSVPTTGDVKEYFEDIDGSYYAVTLNGYDLFIETGNPYVLFYKTDLYELRAAQGGFSTWQTFLSTFDGQKNCVHYRKHTNLGLGIGGIHGGGVLQFLNRVAGAAVGPAGAIGAIGGFAGILNAAKIGAPGTIDHDMWVRKMTRIYEWVRMYATEYYGKKFMVRVPFVLGKIEPDTNKIVLSMEPADGGYIPEEYFTVGAQNGYMPYNYQKFEMDDGRLEAYVKFSGAKQVVRLTYPDAPYDPIINPYVRDPIISRFDLSKLSEDDYIVEQDLNLTPQQGSLRENLFVKCTVDNNLVFMNSTTLFSPRVVITLPTSVLDIVKGSLNFGIVCGVVSRFLRQNNITGFDTWDEDVKQKFAERLFRQFGSDYLWHVGGGIACMPDMAAIPLQSNILTYGPWYAVGADGKVEYENDESLVPWNYGNYQNMNYAGAAKVNDAFTNQTISETGSIEVPDVPNINLGDALINGGPYVTDISCNIDAQGGATTSYRMSAWEYKFGKLNKYNEERYLRLSKQLQDYKRKFRKLLKLPPPLEIGSSTYFRDTLNIPDPLSPHTSAMFIGGDVILDDTDTENIKVKTNIAALAPYRIGAQMSTETYAYKAGMTLDGLFMPFSTNPSCTNQYMPKFGAPTAGATTPTVTELNPFGGASETLIFPDGSDLPDTIVSSEHNSTYVKGIALKAPVVVGGWGYDTNGYPVPNSGVSTSQFPLNYKQRADLWKVGPVDLRWDDSRKVWVTGTDGSMKIGKLNGNLFPSGTVDVTVWVPTSGGFSASTEVVTAVKDWLLPDSTMLATGTQVIIEKTGSYWIVTGAKRPC